MKYYYKVTIDKTAKNMGNNSEGYQEYDRIEKYFKTCEEAKEYIKSTYWKRCKTVPMYMDDSKGVSHKVGKIFCYKEIEYSNPKKYSYFAQDWVQLSKIYETNITF